MKNLTTLLLSVAFLVTGCVDKGQILQEPVDFIIIHGKTYKLMQIAPRDGIAQGIYILYPKDSTDAQPEILNWKERSGKTTINRTLIKVN